MVTLPEKTVDAPGTYDFEYYIPLDLSGEFEEQPTVSQLRERAEQYVEDNNIGIPTVSLSVAFQPLDQTEEYKDIALLERVNLCDTVTVEYPELGVSATAKCIKTVYDALKDRYTSIDLGDAKTNMADTIIQQQKEIEKVPTSSAMQQAILNATNLITGNKGGYVVLRDTTGDGEPDEILIMDTADIETAQKVWRWNNGGLGYSSTGYNGPYGTAITQDGAIVASFITAGALNANIIKTGRIVGQTNPNVYFDLDSGELVAGKIVSDDGEYTVVSEGGDALKVYSENDVIFSISSSIDAETGERKTILATRSQEIQFSDTTMDFRLSLFGGQKETNMELYPYGNSIYTNLSIYPTGSNQDDRSIFIAPDGIFIRDLPVYYNGMPIYPEQ